MSARRILGLEQTFNCSPHGKLWGNKRAQNGEGHANNCSRMEAVVHPVGKTISEVQKAYLAGFIDGDGAIMALLERHPAKRFGFRVRVWVKATQLRQRDVAWLREELGLGQVQASRQCWEWLVKDQSAVHWLLHTIQPFARVKAQQIAIALQILEHRINSLDDVQEQANWADALAALNVRSRGRRQNTAAMIQDFVSRND